MIRYLGVGLGLAMGAGLTSAAGTLLPPMLKGREAIQAMFTTPAGLVSVLAAMVSVAGIVFVGMAGMSKESELPDEEKKKSVAEFNFRKGMTVAIFSGLEFGDELRVARRSRHSETRAHRRAGHIGDLGGNAGPRDCPARRVPGEWKLVYFPERAEQDRGRLRGR
jgi:hypothetical protein